MSVLSFTYLHSSRGFFKVSERRVYIEHANLIDFFLEVCKLTDDPLIILPKMPLRSARTSISIDKGVNILVVPFPCDFSGKGNKIFPLMGFFQSMLNKEMIERIRQSHITASVALEFTGTLFGIIRALVLRKHHSFIVRGDRIKTISQSERSFWRKNFGLLRIHIYKRVLRYLVNCGKADVWFQGQEKYEDFINDYRIKNKSRLFLLNAVLREFPSELELKGEQKKYDLLFVGSLLKAKGILDLIRAVAVLSRKTGRAYSLAVAGEGPQKTAARALSKQLGIEKNVTFLGYLGCSKKLGRLFRQSKLFILPSYTEGLPRAMIESMYLRTPVLCSSVGGIKYIIRDGQNGFLVTPGDPLLLAKKIETIFFLIGNGAIKSIIDAANLDACNFSFFSRAEYYLKMSTTVF